jgi:hypothetical protein
VKSRLKSATSFKVFGEFIWDEAWIIF